MVDVIDKDEFFNDYNVASFIALLQDNWLNQPGASDSDLRPQTFAYYNINMLAYAMKFCLDNSRYVLSQLTPSQSDEYGIFNVWCENYGILPSAGTKTIIKVPCVFAKNITLYHELPEDNVNNFLAQILDINGNTYTIQTTTSFVASETPQDVLFECNEYGAIVPPENTATSIVNLMDGWGINGGSVGNLTTISYGSQPDSLDEIRAKINKSSIMHNATNTYQGLYKALLNIGCKDVKWYKKTSTNNVPGLHNGQTLIVCQGGDSAKIFNVIEQYCLGMELVGDMLEIRNYNNTQYQLRFNYAQQELFYIRTTINKNNLFIDDEEVFKEQVKTRLVQYVVNTFTLSTSTITIGGLYADLTNYFNEIQLGNLIIENIDISLNNSDWGTTLTVNDISNYFTIINNNITVTLE